MTWPYDDPAEQADLERDRREAALDRDDRYAPAPGRDLGVSIDVVRREARDSLTRSYARRAVPRRGTMTLRVLLIALVIVAAAYALLVAAGAIAPGAIR